MGGGPEHVGEDGEPGGEDEKEEEQEEKAREDGPTEAREPGAVTSFGGANRETMRSTIWSLLNGLYTCSLKPASRNLFWLLLSTSAVSAMVWVVWLGFAGSARMARIVS